MRKSIHVLVFSTCALAFARPAAAQQVTISDATNGYHAGIGPNGELYDSITHVGLSNPAGQDYIQPGTPRDSWGVTGSSGNAQADYQDYGTSGITNTVITPGTNSATAVSTLSNGLIITQVYNFFASNILSIQETIANATDAAITDITFRRDVDLDIPPTAFNEETVGPLGSNSSVSGNSYYGFEDPNPASGPFVYQCGSTCNQTGDLGAGIDYLIGTLGAGESTTFAFYYGINQPDQTLDQLFGQAQGLGLNYLIGTQSTENGSYPGNLGSGSGFLGVSSLGTIAGAVPEPSTWAMMLLGFGLIGSAIRYRRRKSGLSIA